MHPPSGFYFITSEEGLEFNKGWVVELAQRVGTASWAPVSVRTFTQQVSPRFGNSTSLAAVKKQHRWAPQRASPDPHSQGRLLLRETFGKKKSVPAKWIPSIRSMFGHSTRSSCKPELWEDPFLVHSPSAFLRSSRAINMGCSLWVALGFFDPKEIPLTSAVMSDECCNFKPLCESSSAFLRQ